MKMLKIAALVGALCLPLAVLSTPSEAATAHNSQRGGLGNSSNIAGPSGMSMRMRQMSGRRMMRHHSMRHHRTMHHMRRM